MRQVAHLNGWLRSPLDSLLGTVGRVRLLRALALRPDGASAQELATATRLALPGVLAALRDLGSTGVVERRRSGRRYRFALREASPLAGMVRQLFHDERHRYEACWETLMAAVRDVHPPLQSAWVGGAVACDADRADDSIELFVIGAPPMSADQEAQLTSRLEEIERSHDVSIAVTALTTGDLEAMPVAGRQELMAGRVLAGLDPTLLLSDSAPATAGVPVRTHADRDREALARGEALARLIAEDPGLVRRARDHLVREMSHAPGGVRSTLAEWHRALANGSIPRLQRLLRDRGERGARFRQSLPFFAVMTPEERDRYQSSLERLEHDDA